MFFFEKKNQKTFVISLRKAECSARQRGTSFFCFFFKNETLALLLAAPSVGF